MRVLILYWDNIPLLLHIDLGGVIGVRTGPTSSAVGADTRFGLMGHNAEAPLLRSWERAAVWVREHVGQMGPRATGNAPGRPSPRWVLGVIQIGDPRWRLTAQPRPLVALYGQQHGKRAPERTSQGKCGSAAYH